jgi:magnesium transporter
MKVLTVFSAFFIPLTFIVGLYGMNFDNLPELHFKYGYLYVWIVMITIVLGLLVYFKKRKWY